MDSPFIIIIAVISILFFITTARIIGWALGIAAIRDHAETLIHQNKKLTEIISELLETQKAQAQRQGPSNIESDPN